jgi:ribonucleoside-diphosphate reductase alpha chain
MTARRRRAATGRRATGGRGLGGRTAGRDRTGTHHHPAAGRPSGAAGQHDRHRQPPNRQGERDTGMTDTVGTPARDAVSGRGTDQATAGAGTPAGANGAGANGAGANGGRPGGLRIERVYTTPGVHPYDEVTWERRDVVMTNWRDGTVNFEQRGVEFPASWSVNATNIVTSKYFRGAVGAPERESSLRQLIDRVVTRYTVAGAEHGYFAGRDDAEVFAHELTWMLLHQVFSFNSPVWFNVGTASPQQVSACFILSVDDTMDSILNWYREEGLIFKGGSGAGLNLSRIRSSAELLSSGGTASGPVSFMRGADASAGTIKSGGATRRAAKMVVLDVDHPDVEEFVATKAREEEKIRVLRTAGFDMDLGGADIASVQYQNANNSVRVSDDFMRAVESGGDFGLRARTTGEVLRTVPARSLWGSIAQAAWACADPGVQYDDTINDWHTCPESGRITASNPCSEYLHLDNSSCNLASLNLLTFLDGAGRFDGDRFARAVELVITAMDISICFADFPTEAIAETTRRFRQLGIGYANLGALLMATGHAYDSEGGRALAATITSLMTGTAYKRSAELAGIVGAYEGYDRNAESHQRVMRKHAAANDLVRTHDAIDTAVHRLATRTWQECLRTGERHGWRNAQASVLAPTGTIGLMMDCDTTGIEPDLALVKFKKLVGGGSMQIVNQTVPRALHSLGYQDEQVEAITEFVGEHGHIVGAPGLRPEHYKVFDCAMGERSIAPVGHVRMMAAVQPFISGGISKTVNMPETATVADVQDIYFQGWKLGLKALAIYRDNCKVGQPLSAGKSARADTAPAAAAPAEARPVRRRLPKKRPSQTVSFTVAGAEGYLHAGSYPDDGLGEIFVKLGKQGSTLAGVMDAFSMSISVGLQYGIPLEFYVSKFMNLRFEPAGMTDDPDVRIATSVLDYLFRRLALDYLPLETRSQLGVFSAEERAAALEAQYGPADDVDLEGLRTTVDATPQPTPARTPTGRAVGSSMELIELQQGKAADAPLCLTCGTKMRPAGSCYVCEGCGSTSGCS